MPNDDVMVDYLENMKQVGEEQRQYWKPGYPAFPPRMSLTEIWAKYLPNRPYPEKEPHWPQDALEEIARKVGFDWDSHTSVLRMLMQGTTHWEAEFFNHDEGRPFQKKVKRNE